LGIATEPIEDNADDIERRLRGGRPAFGRKFSALTRRVAVAAAGCDRQVTERYRITGILGSGAYGVVYRAHDKRLDREVAIKILTRLSSTQVRDALREAQLLAAVSHPNIVEVFEVGLTEDTARSPFVVMELVEGVTLRTLFDNRSLSRDEVLDTVMQAARGLHAAHDAGILHRDFKPANVLIAADGRARVADFGLARETADESTRGHDNGSQPAAGVSTAASVMVGTPAYMAPESFSGSSTTASDQYALCAVLFEGLVGHRPVEASSVTGLARAVRSEPIQVPRSAGLPKRITKVIERGLARDAAARFSDLSTLIAAVERARHGRRWPIAYGATAAAVVLAVGVWSMRGDDACSAEALHFGLGHGSGLHAEVAARLAEYDQELYAAAQQVCAEPDRTRDAAFAQCLRVKAGDAAALAEISREVERGDHGRIAKALAGLAPPSECLDGEPRLMQMPPAALADRVQALQPDVSRLRAMVHAAQVEQGRALSAPTLEQARAIGYAPLHAEVADLRARFLSLTSDFEGARQAHEESYFVAHNTGLSVRAAGAATHLIGLLGMRLNRPDDARKWAEFAAASYARAERDPLESRTYIQGLAYLAHHEGDFEELERLARAGIALELSKGRASEDGHIAMLGFLGVALTSQERYEASLPVYEECERYSASYYGDESAPRAAMLDNRANSLREMGRTEEALSLSLRALHIRESAYTTDNVDLAYSHGNIGLTLKALGRFDSALEHSTAALQIFEKLLGAEHPNLAQEYEHRAGIYRAQGDAALAIADYERALATMRAAGRGESSEAAVLAKTITELQAEVDGEQ